MKMSHFVKSVSVVAFAALASQQALAGAWVPKKGEAYYKIGYADYDSSDFFGDAPVDVNFSGTNTSFYGEYGLGNNWAIYGSLLHQDIEQTPVNPLDGGRTASSGFGDTELGVRYQWQAEPFVLSTSFLVKLPSLYNENDVLPRGNGQEDYEFRVLLGKSLNRYGYLGVEAGYRLRSSSPSDEYRYLLEYGFSATKNLYFRTKLDGILSANNGDTNTVVTNLGNLSNTNEFDLGKWELTAGWNFDKNGSDNQWGVEVTYTQDAYGDNTLEGDSLQVGLTLSY